MSDALDVIACAIERSPGLPPRHVAEVVENDLVNARLLPDPDDQPQSTDFITDTDEIIAVAVDPALLRESLDLDAIQALADAATPGPWEWEIAGHGDRHLISGADGVLFSYPVYDGPTADAHVESADLHVEPADAEFIAEARTLIPALIAELRGYREEKRQDEEWARRVAVDNVRCLYCNLRYDERDQYGCVGDGGRPHEYSDDELRRAREGGE